MLADVGGRIAEEKARILLAAGRVSSVRSASSLPTNIILTLGTRAVFVWK